MDLTPSAAAEVGAALSDPEQIERPRQNAVVVEFSGGLEFDPDIASLPARALGFVVDTIVFAVFLAPGIAVALSSTSLAGRLGGGALALLGLIAMIVLESRAIARSGRWIGNRLARTRVVDARNGSKIDIGSAVGRVVTRHLISPVLFFGFVPALVDRQRRTFHDRVATSIVIGRQREQWKVGDPDTGVTEHGL